MKKILSLPLALLFATAGQSQDLYKAHTGDFPDLTTRNAVVQIRRNTYGVPFTVPKVDVRLCRLNVDIAYNTFEKNYDSSENKARATVEKLIVDLNRSWTPEALVLFELNNLNLRTSAEEDPYSEVSDGYKIFSILREKNRKPEADFVLGAVRGFQFGGLGGGNCALLNSSFGNWFALDHEISHGFGPGHGVGWPYERGPQNIRQSGSPYPRNPKTHFFNFAELDSMESRLKKLKPVKDFNTPVPPYARFDLIEVKKEPESNIRKEYSYEFSIDVLSNDHDANGGKIYLANFDESTLRGGSLKRVSGHGKTPDTLAYVYRSRFAGYTDFDHFNYQIVDETGRTNRGRALILFHKYKNLLKNGLFASKHSGWDFTRAKVVTNGEGSSSPQIDFRALIEPGGEISQTVEFNQWGLKDYELFLVIKSDNKTETTFQVELSNGRKIKRTVSGDAPHLLPFSTDSIRSNVTVRILNSPKSKKSSRVGHVILRPRVK